MEFNVEFLREVQVYAYVIVTGLLVVMLYSYIYHLYSGDKKGTTDYERNAKIALDDNINSTPISGASFEDKNNGANK